MNSSSHSSFGAKIMKQKSISRYVFGRKVQYMRFKSGNLHERICQSECISLDGHYGSVTALCFLGQDIGSEVLVSISDSGEVHIHKSNCGAGTDVTLDPVSSVFGAHGAWSINCVAGGQSRGLFLTGGDDKELKLWDLEGSTSQTQRRPPSRVLPRGPLSPALSPALLQSFEGHRSYVTGCDVAHDGRRLFASSSLDSTVRLWGEGVRASSSVALIKNENPVHCVRFMKDDSQIIVSGDPMGMKVWDLRRYVSPLHSFPCMTSPGTQSCDTHTVAQSADPSVSPWSPGIGSVAASAELASADANNYLQQASPLLFNFGTESRSEQKGESGSSSHGCSGTGNIPTGRDTNLSISQKENLTGDSNNSSNPHIAMGTTFSSRHPAPPTKKRARKGGVTGDTAHGRRASLRGGGVQGGRRGRAQFDPFTRRYELPFVPHKPSCPVFSIRVMSDGRSLLSSAQDGSHKLWDITSRQGYSTLTAASGRRSSASVPPSVASAFSMPSSRRRARFGSGVEGRGFHGGHGGGVADLGDAGSDSDDAPSLGEEEEEEEEAACPSAPFSVAPAVSAVSEAVYTASVDGQVHLFMPPLGPSSSGVMFPVASFDGLGRGVSATTSGSMGGQNNFPALSAICLGEDDCSLAVADTTGRIVLRSACYRDS